jgi:exoribonuclease-2
MLERGLEPDYSPSARAELDAIRGPAAKTSPSIRDMRELLWCSIDNDDSRDLDQLSVAESLPAGRLSLRVAVAEVGALVRQGSAIDGHARTNTTSVYTAGGNFPMLPEKLSTDLTSLNFEAERVSIVIEMVFGADGSMEASSVFEALIRNRAKLAYNSVAAWLDGAGAMPPAIGAVPGLDENIKAQHAMAQILRARRHRRGALSLQTLQSRAVFDGEILQDLKPDVSNVAKNLIEELMVAANGVTARFLEEHRLPTVRRIVRTPAKWDRIAELAEQHGASLPREPDGKALEGFLVSQMKADPVRFPDLSLSVVKLLGRGEYVIEFPGDSVPGHFGLAVAEYAHSTAPNRRFPDLVIQRLLKAALYGSPIPYKGSELVEIAQHCTEQEDAAKKVERQLIKSAAALLLAPKVGVTFDAMVTGAGDDATWVRIFHPPVEGKLDKGFAGLKVGDRLRVQLVHTDVERGYIVFVRVA